MRYLLAIAFLSLSTSAWSEPPLEKGGEYKEKKSEQASATADKNKSVTQQPPVVITVSPTVTANNQPRERAEHEKQESVWEALTSIATVALAFITGVLAYATYWLWKSTSRLVEGAKDTAKKELRAYVCVEDIFFDWRNRNDPHSVCFIHDWDGTVSMFTPYGGYNYETDHKTKEEAIAAA